MPPTLTLAEQAQRVNAISAFLAKRDVAELNRENLQPQIGQPQADLLILLGSSVLAVAEQAARAYRQGLVRELLIAGGIGHSTRFLVENIRRHPRYRTVPAEGRAEADVLKEVLVEHEGIPASAMLIENQSTNCGSNAEEAWRMLQQGGKNPRTILLMQDPTMQLRTDASFRRAWEPDAEVTFVNYAAFIPQLTVQQNQLVFTHAVAAASWELPRFLSLVMGEIPRLTDDAQGYGPRGKHFIAHVDVPADIEHAYRELLPYYQTYLQSR